MALPLEVLSFRAMPFDTVGNVLYLCGLARYAISVFIADMIRRAGCLIPTRRVIRCQGKFEKKNRGIVVGLRI